MFKVTSQIGLVQNVAIVRANGEESIVCLLPHQSVLTRKITPSLQYLSDNHQISIIESNESLQPNTAINREKPGSDSGSFTETINITEFNSKEEKEQIQSSELDSVLEITKLEESTRSEEVVKPKRGRKKKTDGGDS